MGLVLELLLHLFLIDASHMEVLRQGQATTRIDQTNFLAEM